MSDWLDRSGYVTLFAFFGGAVVAAVVVLLVIFLRGGDDDDWIGRQVPLVRVHASNPTTGGSVETFHVAPLTEWDELQSNNGTVAEATETSSGGA